MKGSDIRQKKAPIIKQKLDGNNVVEMKFSNTPPIINGKIKKWGFVASNSVVSLGLFI
jgi:hypothetical protein